MVRGVEVSPRDVVAAILPARKAAKLNILESIATE